MKNLRIFYLQLIFFALFFDYMLGGKLINKSMPSENLYFLTVCQYKYTRSWILLCCCILPPPSRLHYMKNGRVLFSYLPIVYVCERFVWYTLRQDFSWFCCKTKSVINSDFDTQNKNPPITKQKTSIRKITLSKFIISIKSQVQLMVIDGKIICFKVLGREAFPSFL